MDPSHSGEKGRVSKAAWLPGHMLSQNDISSLFQSRCVSVTLTLGRAGSYCLCNEDRPGEKEKAFFLYYPTKISYHCMKRT